MLLVLIACVGTGKDPGGTIPDDSAQGDTGATGPEWRGAAWCGRVAAAHATIRLFGAEAQMIEADAALIAALEQEPPWDSVAALAPYAEALGDTCAVEAGVAADLATDDPDGALGEIPAAAALEGEGTQALLRRSPFNEDPEQALTPGTARAALVVAHGALRRFYPYFHLRDTVDGALLSMLAEPVPATRWDMQLYIARFGAELRDGHVFWGSIDGERSPDLAGYAPWALNRARPEDPPFIVGSHIDGIAAGDTLSPMSRSGPPLRISRRIGTPSCWPPSPTSRAGEAAGAAGEAAGAVARPRRKMTVVA